MIAIYPGSFDPITKGHLDIIERSSKMFDEVIVVILENSSKKSFFDLDQRVQFIKQACKHLKNVKVDYDHTTTIAYAKKVNACAMIRGVRSVKDYEYELNIASVNQYIDPSIETILLFAKSEYSFISSSNIKELLKYGIGISNLVPDCVNQACIEKIKE